MSVFRYFIRSSIMRLASFGVSIAAVFVVTPHIVKSVGASGYGLWCLVSSFAFYFILLEFGMLQTVAKKYAEARANDAPDKILGIYSCALCISFVAALIVIITGAVLAAFADRLSDDVVEGAQTGMIVFIFSAAFSIHMLSRPAFGMLGGALRWSFMACINMLRTLGSCGVLLLWLSPQASAADNLLRLSTASSIFIALEALVYFATVRWSLGVPFRFRLISRGMLKELFRFSLPVFIIQLGEFFKFRIQVFIVAGVLGVLQLSYYSIARQFIGYVNDIMLNIFGVLNPYFSRLQSKGDHQGYRTSFLEALTLSYTISSCIGLGLIFYGAPFIQRWLGTEFLGVTAVLTPLAVTAILSSGDITANGFLVGTGGHRPLALLALAQGAVMTLLCIPAAFLYGLAGVGWITVLSSLPFNQALTPILVCKRGGIPLGAYYLTSLKALAPQIIVQTSYYLLIREYLNATYPSIMLAAAGQCLVAGAVFAARIKLAGPLGGVAPVSGEN